MIYLLESYEMYCYTETADLQSSNITVMEKYMKFVIATLLLTASVTASVTASAGPCWWIAGNGGHFKGTDLVDGGESFRTFIEEDGICSMRGGDSWHGPCGYGWPAVVYSDDLEFRDNSLNGDWSLDCQAAPTDVTGDRFLKVKYTRIGGGAVKEQLLDQEGVPLGRPEIIFYRVSEK